MNLRSLDQLTIISLTITRVRIWLGSLFRVFLTTPYLYFLSLFSWLKSQKKEGLFSGAAYVFHRDSFLDRCLHWTLNFLVSVQERISGVSEVHRTFHKLLLAEPRKDLFLGFTTQGSGFRFGYKGNVDEEGFRPVDLLWHLSLDEIGKFVVWNASDDGDSVTCLWVTGPESGKTFRLAPPKQPGSIDELKAMVVNAGKEIRHIAVPASTFSALLQAAFLLILKALFGV